MSLASTPSQSRNLYYERRRRERGLDMPRELAFVLISATWRGIRIQTAVGRIALRFLPLVAGATPGAERCRDVRRTVDGEVAANLEGSDFWNPRHCNYNPAVLRTGKPKRVTDIR